MRLFPPSSLPARLLDRSISSFRRGIRTRRFPLLLNLIIILLMVVPAFADYLGPDRTVTTYVNRRKRCHYVAVYDPPGVGYYACTLNLYTTPTASCPGYVDDFFNPTACVGWSVSCDDPGISCSISRSSTLVSCSAGQTGCRSTAQTTTHPPATISGTVDCPQTGSAGWCVAGSTLVLTGFEPLSGYSILAIEGTRNGETFACTGDACSVPLLEGGNTFTFWALSDWGDSSAMGTASGSVDTREPVISGVVSGTPGDNGWWVSEAVLTAAASDPAPGSGMDSFQVSIDGGGYAAVTGPITLGDGVRSVDLRAADTAGHVANSGQTILVDTQPPVTGFTSPAEGSTTWATGVIQLAGVSADAVSGVAAAELSTDGGASWQALTPASDGSWSADWDTRGAANGTYTVLARARDSAGHLSNLASVTVQVDNGVPVIDMPASWMIWTPVRIRVEDGGIGLDSVRLRISSSDYGTRTYTWTRPPETFTWDRHFGDVIAPIGTYRVVVEAWDKAGNMGSAQGEIVIPPPDSPPPTDESSPAVGAVDEPPPVEETGSGGDEPLAPPAPAATATSVPQVALTFGEEAEPAGAPEDGAPGTVLPPAGSTNLLWGAAATALIGAATAFALNQRRKRKAEEARQAAAAAQFNARQEALEKQQARQAALEAHREAEAARLAAEQRAQSLDDMDHLPQHTTRGARPDVGALPVLQVGGRVLTQAVQVSNPVYGPDARVPTSAASSQAQSGTSLTTNFSAAAGAGYFGGVYGDLVPRVLQTIQESGRRLLPNVIGYVHEDLWLATHNSNLGQVVRRGWAWLNPDKYTPDWDGGITSFGGTTQVQAKSIDPSGSGYRTRIYENARLSETYGANQELLVTAEAVEDVAGNSANPGVVRSSGVSHAEAEAATLLGRDALAGSTSSFLKLSLQTANQAAVKAGGVGAIISGGISAAVNTHQVINGNITGSTAVARTTVDTVGGAVAAASGAWAGAMAGALAGAAIGTVVPGAGNVVGAVVGFGVGLATSFGVSSLYNQHVREPFTAFLENGLSAYPGILENGKIIVKAGMDRAGEAVSSAWNGVTEGASELGSTIKEGVSDVLGDIFGGDNG